MAQKEISIETDKLFIDKNIISFNNAMVQISNISSIEIKSPPKKEISFWAFQFLIAGVLIFLFGLNVNNDNCTAVGSIFIIGFIIYVLIIINENSDKGDRYLNLFLSSGYIYSIYCDDPKFLRRVIDVLENCMNNHLFNQRIKIDFKNCKISNSTISPKNETMTDHRRSINNNGNIISGQDLKGNSFNANSNNHWYYVKKKYKSNVNFPCNIGYIIRPVSPFFLIPCRRLSHIHLAKHIRNDCEALPCCRKSLCIGIPACMHGYN